MHCNAGKHIDVGVAILTEEYTYREYTEVFTDAMVRGKSAPVDDGTFSTVATCCCQGWAFPSDTGTHQMHTIKIPAGFSG